MQKKIFLATLFTVWTALFAGLAMASSSEAIAKDHYNRGTALYTSGNFEAAEKELSRAITLEPSAPDAYYNRGWSYRRRHMNTQAIADFSRAIALYPLQPSYFLSRSNARIVEGDLRGAAEDATKAVGLLPESSRGYFLRGVASLINGDPQKALEDGVRSLSLDPEYADAKRLVLESLVKREQMIQQRSRAVEVRGPAAPSFGSAPTWMPPQERASFDVAR